jgi:hypothetical protein
VREVSGAGILEFDRLAALTGKRLVGPYSRFGRHVGG